MRQIKENEKVKLEDNLFFAGTIYDSFEALEEAMGKLQLERPLFLVYLAKKAFAEEVFKAAGEENESLEQETLPMSGIILNDRYFQHLQ
ncbi:MAG: hypothetical protein J6N45_03330 [Alphaproteobacteria bacterium]|nr:hypothetical protein [Alphaproteobacteria bacterium]